ncbi:MAG TPA: beta-galactosidase [Vicinamibacterales bacterium]|jgi:beta-galactosidase GanA|nr:beta-galactosidase [Vicinamibacterales bacterium]
MRFGVCAAVAGVLCVAAYNPQPTEPFVPIGVWYAGGTTRAPMVSRNPAAERDRWRRDLVSIKSLGFNSVKTWVDWASAEPERGRYRFDALEQLLTLSDEVGLKVILQIYTDAAPEWLGKRYPDSSFVTDQGARIGSQASPGYCLDHGGVRADMIAFIGAASTAAARHSSFYGVDVWSEPHVVNWVWFNTPAEFCFCANTQARFRDWLKRKYQSLDAINAAWYRTFSAWDQVEAPRFGTILSYTDLIDWKTFIATKLQEDLKIKADASAPRGARPVSSHSDAPAIMLSPLSGFGNPDDWWMTRAVDYYGTSIYPKHAAAATPWSAVRLTSALDGIRSAAGDRGWWIGELQAGQGATGVRVAAPVTGADLRLWGWAAISRGARAISYYAWYPMSSGYESNGYGMIELDGTITDRARIAGEFAGVVARNAALFAPLQPHPSRVAILYNRLSYLVGGNTVAPGTIVRNSMLGLYRALFEQNIQVDFIHPDDVVAGAASKYAVIYLSYPVMLQQPVADALNAYVRGGGTLISEARPAWNDERGLANERIPGAGLDRTFGARERQLRAADSIPFTMESTLEGPLAPLAGRTFHGLGFAEHLDPAATGTRVLARFGGDGERLSDPAMVTTSQGAGRAILIGTFPSAAFEQDPDKMRSTGELLQRLIASAGVAPEIRIDGGAGRVEARFLESSNAIVLIAINHGDTAERVTFKFGPDVPEAIWQNMETGSAVNFVQGPDGPTYAHAFGARDVMVLVRGKRLR